MRRTCWSRANGMNTFGNYDGGRACLDRSEGVRGNWVPPQSPKTVPSEARRGTTFPRNGKLQRGERSEPSLQHTDMLFFGIEEGRRRNLFLRLTDEWRRTTCLYVTHDLSSLLDLGEAELGLRPCPPTRLGRLGLAGMVWRSQA